MVSADALLEMSENFAADTLNLFKVVFKEDDLVRRKEGVFELQEYYDHPERYESKFENYLPQLSILVNCIFWSEKYPRLVTKRFLRDSAPLNSSPKLKVIGDISCDINGSVEITHKATPPDQAFYTYFPQEDRSQDGIQRLGVTVMAVDNLPCEFSRESSQEFSAVLRNFVPAIAQADFRRPGQNVQLPPAIKKALILQGGKLTADYAYMEKFLS